jgi:4-hydroxyphenylpyruvate dioxygenase
MKARGCVFLTVPDKYYDNLWKSLAHSKVQVKEDIDILQKLQILVDYDDNGYLLQLFTKPVEDRPTLFFEII